MLTAPAHRCYQICMALARVGATLVIRLVSAVFEIIRIITLSEPLRTNEPVSSNNSLTIWCNMITWEGWLLLTRVWSSNQLIAHLRLEDNNSHLRQLQALNWRISNRSKWHQKSRKEDPQTRPRTSRRYSPNNTLNHLTILISKTSNPKESTSQTILW